MKRYRKPFSTIALIRDNTTCSVRLRTIGNPDVRNFMTSQKTDFAKLFADFNLFPAIASLKQH